MSQQIKLQQIADITATATELNYTDGVTSAIQTQLDAKAPLAAPAFTGTATGVNLTLSGDLTVNGTTTTINTTNLVVSDNLIELNNGAGSNANDSGIVIERGSTGDNAIFAWDESADAFVMGTTTATGASTGNLTIANGELRLDTLRIDQSGTGLRMTNVGAFDNDGSDNFRIFASNDLQLKANGDSGGGLSIDVTNNDVTIDNDLRVSAGQFYYGGTAVTSTATELNLLDGVTGTLVTEAGTQTLTNKTINTASNTITIVEADISDLGTYLTASDITGKLNLSGGTMSGAIAMGTNKITGMGDPTAAQDAATKAYVDSQVSSGDITSVTASTGLTGGGTTGDVTLSIDSTVATLTGTQTLTNKTITSPTISNPTLTGTYTFTSDATSTPAMTLTANSINDGVGALRINGSQADIFLNPSTATHTTITFAVNDDQRLAFGMDNNSDFYITRRTSSTWYDDTFVLDRDTGLLSLGYGATVAGTLTYSTLNDGTTALTSTVAELNYVDGVTSNIQTQIDAKTNNTGTVTSVAGTGTVNGLTLSGTVTSSGSLTLGGTFSATVSEISDLTATAAELNVLDGIPGTLTATELGYVDGVTSAIQTQIDAKAPLAAPAFTGTATGVNLTLSGDLTVNGTTTTVNTTNLVVSDNLIELNNGAASNANDSGIVIERGSTGDNAFIGWDESADKFIVGTTTATGASTGNLTISTGTLVANLEGDVTGNADTATALATARNIAGQSFDGTGNISIASTDLSDTASIVLTTASQTLTNKTLTSPVISSISNTGTLTLPTSTGTIALTSDISLSTLSVTATASELNILDGVTATTAELNYTDGVTSNIQTQLDAKLALAGGTMSGAIAMGTNKITGMGDPTAAQDAATKAYVDSQGGGGIADVVEDTTPQLGGNLQTNSNDIVFADNDQAIFGAGSDLTIKSDGANALIQGSGSTYFRGGTVIIGANGGSGGFETGIRVNEVSSETSQVELYYDNGLRLETVAGGVDVTGTVTADGLDISGSSGATLTLTSTDTSGADTELLGQIDFVSSDVSGGSAGTQARIKGVYEDNGDSSGIAFLTGASTGSGSPTINEVMRIRHEGNVGIGTSNPQHKFHITHSGTGAIPTDYQMGATSPNDNYQAIHNNSNSATFSGLALETRTSGASRWLIANEWKNTYLGDLVFRNRNAALTSQESMRITSAGNVGIGTSSPSATFRTSIKGDYSSIIGGIEFDSGGGDKFTIGHASATSPSGILNVVGAGNLVFKTNNTEAMRIDASGHVGIGTTGIGTRANSLSIESTGSNSPWVAKSSSYATVASILPWSSCHNYIGTGIYFDDGSWVHSADTTDNSLFALHGAGANWYSSNNSTGSWNVASNVPLWNQSGQWTGDINTTYDINTGVITGTATAARYADLAEKYTTDYDYEAGTVLVFGGDEEVTQSTQRLDRRVAGIVSTDPAHLMNSELENSVAVGLQGRVPCKVVGEIRKGDMMVTSSTPGHAEAWREESNPPMGGVIGKALENKTGAGADVIEVVVGRL